MEQETSYRANPLLKKVGVNIEFTEKNVKEFIKCKNDVCYFVENYVKIINLDNGLVKMKLYDFQRDILQLYNENKLCILKMPRQSSKTTTTVAYFLWLSLFNDHHNIAILANKGSLAREILARYQLAYENLPLWLQQGIVVWNKGNVELENGSKILAAATSSSAIRGYSFNTIFMDEVGHISNNIAEEFFTSVYPTISSGKNTKLIMSSTPNGMNLFYKFWTDANANRNGFVPFTITWDRVPGRDENWYRETLAAIGQVKFDQEYNTHFLGSSNTLISGEKLATLTYLEPINNFADMIIYEEPIKAEYNDDGIGICKDHIYFITVDVSEGKNLDYSAFSVFDCSVMPYKQVAVYRSNSIPPILFPTLIKTCAEYYNNAYVLIEINNNPQVASVLLKDLEYENVFKVYSGNAQAQSLTPYATAKSQSSILDGLRMSPLVKRIGCSTLKTLIENDKLVINDFNTISELTTFTQMKKSFCADEGCNDDLVMTLVIFAWMSSQPRFKEIVDKDIRLLLQEEHFRIKEEQMMLSPTKLFDTNINKNYFVEDGAVWIEGTFDDYNSLIKEFFN